MVEETPSWTILATAYITHDCGVAIYLPVFILSIE
jgi:hypothetical protein